jgi:hypothetical protein
MGSIEALFSAAAKARLSAYAPYWGFAVGAARRTVSGAIFSGANVENAAYPIGTCAEAAAIAAMVAAGQRRIAVTYHRGRRCLGHALRRLPSLLDWVRRLVPGYPSEEAPFPLADREMSWI